MAVESAWPPRPAVVRPSSWICPQSIPVRTQQRLRLIELSRAINHQGGPDDAAAAATVPTAPTVPSTPRGCAGADCGALVRPDAAAAAVLVIPSGGSTDPD